MPVHATELKHYGILAATGADARAFLHAQLTNDVEHLPAAHARFAGWCSPKGRLLASLLVVPHDGGLLLQLARDIAAPVAKRLSMFILRAKARLADESDLWFQYGAWGADAPAALMDAGLAVPAEHLAVASNDQGIAILLEPQRFLVLARAPLAGLALASSEDEWALAEIRAGRATITLATQDHFVPQMANLEKLGAVDFRKGCYPGQEIVARTQYRGILKRRMYRLRGDALRAGQDLFSDDAPGQPCGTVVSAAGNEALAVLQIAAVEQQVPIRAAAGAPPLELLTLPYDTTATAAS